MGAHDTASFPYLETVRSVMRQALAVQVPLLGICLGGQLLAQVAGGTVASPSPHGELGICQVDVNPAGAADPLFAGVPSTFTTFQLHNDSFTVPPAATLLASSGACPAQAFRLGSCCYGLQFHPEVDRAIVTCWGDSLKPPRDLLSGFLAAESAFNAASHTLLANFLALGSHSRS
jgi:GMP synthase-like glutamine amidotransferase